MIQLFTIFSKGGLVLWYFSEGSGLLNATVNEFIRNGLLSERSKSSYNHDGHTIKYKLDNEFDLIILVVYQSVLQLAYADKLLSEVHLLFRDMYKNVLRNFDFILMSGTEIFNSFDNEFQNILTGIKSSVIDSDPKMPRTFQESNKSKKTIASMIDSKENKLKVDKKAQTQKLANEKKVDQQLIVTNQKEQSEEDDEILRNRDLFFQKKKGKAANAKDREDADQMATQKKGKQARKWDLTGNQRDAPSLDYSLQTDNDNNVEYHIVKEAEKEKFMKQNKAFLGKFKGELPSLETDPISKFEDNSDNESTIIREDEVPSGGWLSAFKSLVGSKQLSGKDIEPVLEKMKETLITKNVAAEPAEKICQSIETRLEGKVIGTFNRITSIVRESLRDALIQLLTPKRRVDILRDILDAKSQTRPYVIVFCGVNGVGKSTNLAKITFWLNENGHRVLIAAGDTFRAGAVEQLRTHAHYLNALHPQGVQLFEQGYGKDPATIAAAAIHLATERKFDVVLVDTAGRMQDNEPLMRALSKLINVNKPDLVLFVGEALVGNEAVDQLVKFNQALADHSAVGEKSHLIDGIVLTKFDTIDDKVGAAISMTYITGQPIVFVGTGQTYHDIRQLNVNAVVNSLLK